MKVIQAVTLPFIKVARKYFRNTWVHRLPITSWLYKKIFHVAFGNTDKEIVFRGKKFLLPTKDTSMVPSIMNGDYEEFELSLYEYLLKKNYVVLDIGANLGIYAVLGSAKVGPKGSIHSFEPVPENLKYLRHNKKLNQASNIKINPAGIGDKGGRVKIYLADKNVGTHSMGGSSTKKHIWVDIETIDDYVKRNDLEVNLIKMDIEGYEGHAVRGATKTLRKATLLTEFTASRLKQCGDSPLEVANQLLGIFKYCYVIDERKKALLSVDSASRLVQLENSNLLLSHKPVSFQT